MHFKLLVSSLILLIACGPLSAQTPTPEPDSQGLLQRLVEKAREAKAKVQNMGEVVLEGAGVYYEDYVQPVTDSYVQWASDVKTSVWEKILAAVDNLPFKATKMIAKYTLGLILALQVSMSLCQIPPPDRELVEKYEQMRATFYMRLLTAYTKFQEAAAPLVERIGDMEQGQATKDFVEGVMAKPEFKAFAKVAAGAGQEVGRVADTARTAALGVYGSYVRPYVGTYLSDAIDDIKVYLDKFLPVA
ncbi:hypothetical protein PAMP_002865 [Pampus punctatissimus]